MKINALLCSAILAVGFVSGCKNPEAQVVGKWNGPQGVTLTFNQDKTFTQGGVMAATGKWSLKEKTVSLSVETIGGKPATDFIDQMAKMAGDKVTKAQIDEAKAKLTKMDLTLGEDGKSLTQKGANGQTATLTKDDGTATTK
jgi:hypothetical protein